MFLAVFVVQWVWVFVFQFSLLPILLQVVENPTFDCKLIYNEYSAVSKGWKTYSLQPNLVICMLRILHSGYNSILMFS